MKCSLHAMLYLLCGVLLCAQTAPVPVSEIKSVPAKLDIAAADQLYRAGKFGEAETAYESLIKADPKLVSAQLGLVWALLRQQKIDESLEAVNSALVAQPNSAPLLAAKGDIQFRRGEMSDAELSYVMARKLDAKEIKAHLGLARLYESYSLYRKAYDELQTAHDIAPERLEVQRAWLTMLPRKERLAALEAYLARAHPDDHEDTRQITEYRDFLRATANKPVHVCQLANKIEQTETKLEGMYIAADRMGGVSLSVKLNGQKTRLLLDTGNSGVMVSRKVAEKLRLIPIFAAHYEGIGDKGVQTGYAAVADHIQIGNLEFQDCVVFVSDKRSVADEDGLIGADVFRAYLIDIDFPGMRLKLSPLPTRPEDSVAVRSLNSEGDEQPDTDQNDSEAAETTSKDAKSGVPQRRAPQRLPRDSFIAPEMARWTKVFRFGHTLLVPTRINDSKPMLFMLDTGTFRNSLSLRAGRQVTKVHFDDRVQVRGLSGNVNKVYSSDKVTLFFGHLQQESHDIVTLDLSTLSRHTGTEVSGFLGYLMLRLLEVKLDYRDGLVDFVYDPKRLPIFLH